MDLGVYKNLGIRRYETRVNSLELCGERLRHDYCNIYLQIFNKSLKISSGLSVVICSSIEVLLALGDVVYRFSLTN